MSVDAPVSARPVGRPRQYGDKAERRLILDATATDLLSGNRKVVPEDRGTVDRWLCSAANLLLGEAQQAAPLDARADPIQELISKHAELLADGPYAHYCYFELAYTRQTQWMAWLCSKPREDDPSRIVIAKGQGDTAEAACADALAAGAEIQNL